MPAVAQVISGQTLQSLFGGVSGQAAMPMMPVIPGPTASASNPNSQALVGVAVQMLPKLLGNGTGTGSMGGAGGQPFFGPTGANPPFFGPAGGNAPPAFSPAQAGNLQPPFFGPPASQGNRPGAVAGGIGGAGLQFVPVAPNGGSVKLVGPNTWEVYDAQGHFVERVSR